MLAWLSVETWCVTGAVAAFALLVAWRRMRIRRRETRRRVLRAEPFPAEWQRILRENVPLYRRLPAECRDQLHGHIRVFLAEKRFEGCGGLQITDEIRLTIAAQACVLLLGRPATYYPKLSAVLVYPTAYVVRDQTSTGGGMIVDVEQVRAGESWTRGEVVIASDQALAGAANIADGHDVVLHEFAHQLDQEDGSADGAPILATRSAYGPWARVLSIEFADLQERARRGRRSLLNKYGATNPAEFFAVATEAFFEKPRHLKRTKPDLYAQLAAYYRLDPAAWPQDDPTRREG